MALQINKVYDCNVYVNDTSRHGTASEVTCPEVNYTMNDYNALGMIGTAKFFNGIEGMESTIKWTYPDNECLQAFANPLKAIEVMVRSNKAVYDNQENTDNQAVVILMRGFPTKHQGGTFAPKADVEVESTLAVNYYKLEVDGVEILEIDTIANIFKIDGNDIWSEVRNNLGL